MCRKTLQPEDTCKLWTQASVDCGLFPMIFFCHPTHQIRTAIKHLVHDKGPWQCDVCLLLTMVGDKHSRAQQSNANTVKDGGTKFPAPLPHAVFSQLFAKLPGNFEQRHHMPSCKIFPCMTDP